MTSLAIRQSPQGLPVVASLSEVIMNRFSPVSLCIALSVLSSPGWAQSVVPMKGQSSQQTQADINECNSIANSQASSTSSQPSGGRVKGAAVGAAAGAVASGVRSNQHDAYDDRVDSDVKQNVRQDRAKETAAAGMVVGGSRQRQERRADEKTTQANTASAYSSCLQGKGYQVNP